MKDYSQQKAKKSLQTILLVLFLLFSIVPLAFLTGISFVKYEDALNGELELRLKGNVREIGVIFDELEKNLASESLKAAQDSTLQYHLSVSSSAELEKSIKAWLVTQSVATISVFNSDGKMLATAHRDENGAPTSVSGEQISQVFLPDTSVSKIKNKSQTTVVEFLKNNAAALVIYTQIISKNGKNIGFIEQVVNLDQTLLVSLKKRLNLEIAILSPEGRIVIATHPDFSLYSEKAFASKLALTNPSLFDLTIRKEPFGFLVQPLAWGEAKFYISIGASKKATKALLQDVYYAFIIVFGVIAILVIVFSIITSRTIVKPVKDLVNAIRSFRENEEALILRTDNETEIGILIESFNDMLQRVVKARTELQNKIVELENAYVELKQTQAILVHSAKMASLGQLVAGVAHELNNPIGFIYSNMSALRDYSEKLNSLIEIAETNPSSLADRKKEVEYDYITQDLPRLIKSCEDGARRTRDIVIGLRNFSRLEEAKLSKVDIHSCINETLNLLSGEFKNRIQINKIYGELPLVECYPSQLNQVFMNILSNAAQAIENTGEISITTSVDKMSEEEWIKISIADNGKGIPTATLEKIFDPFFTTKNIGKGTGLGLSISYGIIEQHGGDIKVSSKVGIGTEFTITLPVSAKISNK